jgi:hypothetical protein
VLLVITISPAVTTVAAIVLAIATLLAVAAIIVLRRILFEALILLSHIGQKVLAKLLCGLNVLRIGPTMVQSVGEQSGDERKYTYATCRYMGSSLSLPVLCSVKPEPRPLI